MADIWLPGWPRHIFPNARGKPYQFTHNPKGCLHTTEGGSISGALGAYAPYPPHGIYDWRSRERLQHIPLNLASYSAMDGNDDDYLVQIELVGFAADTRTWPEQALRNIAEDVIGPIERAFGVPRTVVWHGFKDGRDGITLATESSPIRLTPTQLRDFSGWLGHQHLPSPDSHWDPGALPMARILSYLPAADSGGKAAPARVLEDDTMLIRNLKTGETAVLSGGVLTGVSSTNANATNQAAGGGLMLGVDPPVWDDMVRKSRVIETLGQKLDAIATGVTALAPKPTT